MHLADCSGVSLELLNPLHFSAVPIITASLSQETRHFIWASASRRMSRPHGGGNVDNRTTDASYPTAWVRGRIYEYTFSDAPFNRTEKYRGIFFFSFFFDPSFFTRRLSTMGLHGETFSISFCLLRIPLPVVYHFLFDTDPLWHCLSIFFLSSLASYTWY